MENSLMEKEKELRMFMKQSLECSNKKEKELERAGKLDELLEEGGKLDNALTPRKVLIDNKHGEEVYRALTVALKELNEYNLTDRSMVQELWNFGENRKATMIEGALHVLENLKTTKSGND
ncbi:hypothetical protein Q3G72_033672 [Acer saccharum]|nr:hypothetical protein Q3G72_033672 [Acer saccharum]